ncbi:MAG: hypothetical protein FWC40_01100 [Proteobacteria bacterium]|nr:hypothetical protein [Pseudomonadota bacterium]
MISLTSLDRLADRLCAIQDVALGVHETLEAQGVCPLMALEHLVFGLYRRLDPDVRASMLWHCLLLTRARLSCVQVFQEQVLSKLGDPTLAFIIRQLMCRAPRVWSYRRSYQRGFVHTVAGPLRHQEISIEGSVLASGMPLAHDHLYALGWTLSFENQTFLVCASLLSNQQIFEVEKIRPYPCHRSDDDYWEETQLTVLHHLYTSHPRLSLEPCIALGPTTSYAPEKRFARLQRLVLSTIQGDIRRSLRNVHDDVARGDASSVMALVEKATEGMGDEVYFRNRMLEALGCDRDGGMPKAHPAILASDPVALLLLPETAPVFSAIHSRESIKTALAYENITGGSEVKTAFETYCHERRWLMSYDAFDLTNEEHAAIIGVPYDSIRAVFSPMLFEASLPIAPHGEYLRQLQDKFGMYLHESEPPTFRAALEALLSRKIQRVSGVSALVQWVFQCCERWRYCLSDIEPMPYNAHRSLDQSSQTLLRNGLSDLAAMFDRKGA